MPKGLTSPPPLLEHPSAAQPAVIEGREGLRLYVDPVRQLEASSEDAFGLSRPRLFMATLSLNNQGGGESVSASSPNVGFSPFAVEQGGGGFVLSIDPDDGLLPTYICSIDQPVVRRALLRGKRKKQRWQEFSTRTRVRSKWRPTPRHANRESKAESAWYTQIIA